MKPFFRLFLMLFYLATSGCSDNASDTNKQSIIKQDIRKELSFSTLSDNQATASLVSMTAFKNKNSPASNRFEGTLTLFEQANTEQFNQLSGDPLPLDQHYLPTFSFKFVQDGSNLIPVQRGVILSNNSRWEYIMEPGKVWDEVSDNGFSRVAIPFALQQKNQNCIHNGILSFLFKNDGQISKIAYQISTETCLYIKFDMWGLVFANYTPSVISNANTIKSNYQIEQNSRLATKPITDLEIDYPNSKINLSAFSEGITPTHMTLYGLVDKNVHYTGGCETRHGTYPYCDVMVIPSYSTSKSLFTAMALMRLQQKYPGVINATISTFVPECTGNSNWIDVSFKNTLNMVTGNYTSPDYFVDETNSVNFFSALTHNDKINFACSQWPRQAKPNQFWNYHTSDTYLLTAAMNDYLQQQEGANKDIFTDAIVNDIWIPLRISPTALVSKRTYDNSQQSWGGYGLNLHRDDIAKLSNFLNIDNGKIQSTQLLDISMLQQALQRVPNSHGQATGLLGVYYNNGFWGANIAGLLGCKNEVWVPFMQGFGGIIIALLPNGMTYYNISDNDEYSWIPAVIEANKIKSMCLS